jgi:hypothetical protein
MTKPPEDASPGNSQDSSENPATLSIQVPPFNAKNPALWFALLEAQFEAAKITKEKTKYLKTVMGMPIEMADIVSDIILSPPPENQYETLKQQVIERLTDSQQTKIKKLLHEMELGDKRPSQLLREMKELAQGKLDNDVLKSLWMEHLPQQAQAVIACAEGSLDKIAIMADKVNEFSKPSVYSVGATAGYGQRTDSNFESSSVTAQLKSLDERMSNLESQMAELLKRGRDTSRAPQGPRKPKFRPRSRSKTPVPEDSDKPCFYHKKFGDKSYRCEKPCGWKKQLN